MTKLSAYIIAALVIFLSGFFIAKRYYSTNKTETVTQNRTITKIVKVIQHDGTVSEVTTIDSATKTDKVQTIARANKSNLSILAGSDFTQSQIKPLYGLSFSKEVIGPVTLGVFALTNSTVGVSIGYSF